MRPVLIADIDLASAGRISRLAEGGWMVVAHAADRSVTVLDADLHVAARIDVPVASRQFMASVSERHLAAVTLDELVVCDRLGGVLWRREHTIPRADMPCEPNCHLDARGVLWVYLPAGDELVAYDAASGEEIDRVRLDSSVGAAAFFPHPDRERLGLHVAMGQETPLSHLAWLVDGRIRGRNLLGGFLTGFTSTGDQYLALPHMEISEITIRDLATGQAVVACDSAEIPGYDCDCGYDLMEAAALVSDDFVLSAVFKWVSSTFSSPFVR